MARDKIEMDVVNPKCEGIDVGSKSHFISIGQNLEDVKEFGVYAEDLTSVCKHLTEHGITSVALESTGNYWQNLYVELMRFGFDVTLCNGKFTKNIKGRNCLPPDRQAAERWPQVRDKTTFLIIIENYISLKYENIDAQYT